MKSNLLRRVLVQTRDEFNNNLLCYLVRFENVKCLKKILNYMKMGNDEVIVLSDFDSEQQRNKRGEVFTLNKYLQSEEECVMEFANRKKKQEKAGHCDPKTGKCRGKNVKRILTEIKSIAKNVVCACVLHMRLSLSLGLVCVYRRSIHSRQWGLGVRCC